MRFKKFHPKSIARNIVVAFGGLAIAVALLLMFSSSTGAEDETARASLEGLSLTEREELRRKSETFEGLPESERERMRELHVAITSSPDSDRLSSVMLNYHEWLKTLTLEDRTKLLKLPSDERIGEIKRLMEEQRQQRFRDLVRTELSSEDVRAIFRWLDQYAAKHQDDLLALLPEDTRQRLEQPQFAGPRQRMMLMMEVGKRGDEVQMPAPSEDEVAKLNESLSDNAQKALAEIPQREQKMQLVRQWLRAGAASRWTPQISRERLMEFYREYRESEFADKKRVEELDSMPPEQFYAEVTKMYFRSRGHWRRDGDHRGGPPQGGWDNRDGRDGRDDGRDEVRGDGRDSPRGGRDGQRGPGEGPRRPPDGERPDGPPFADGERPRNPPPPTEQAPPRP